MIVTLSENAALDAIRDAMSGKWWGADTLETIAGIIRDTGRTIEEAPGDTEGAGKLNGGV